MSINKRRIILKTKWGLTMANIITSLMIIFSLASLLNPVYADTALLDVKVDYDKKFDFSQLNDKYQWVKRKKSSRDHYASIDPDINEYFLSVVNKKLTEKGYQNTHDGSASFGIDYEVVIKSSGAKRSLEDYSAQVRKTRRSATNIPSLPNIKNMKVGTIILNIVDMKTGYLEWVGYAEAVVVEKKNREELIDQAISKMLAEFPPN
jgi:hypothetical protein